MAPRLRLLLTLLPAACATPGEREAAAFQAALASSRASLAAVVPEAPTPVSLPAPAQPPQATLPGTRPVAAAQFLGAGPEAVRRWLGEPALRRAEGQAEIWLYAGTACALDLVLYPERGGLRVAHAAARASGTESRTEAACLRELGGARPRDSGARSDYTPGMTMQRADRHK